MGRKGRPTKYVLTYEQRIWDNYSPYRKPVDKSGEKFDKHLKEKTLKRMKKVLEKMSGLAGYQKNDTVIDIISNRLLNAVYLDK
jgi:hypothetical protein